MKRIICILCACLLLFGCSSEGKSVTRQVWAMDTYMDVQLWGKEAQAVTEELETLLYQLEQDWSVTNPDSLIYYPEKANRQQRDFLQDVEALSIRTDGAFNPYLGGLTEAWGFLSKEYTVPTQEQIHSALAQQKLDLGGAVKGYAGRRAVALLEASQVESALLNLGGNVQTYGKKSDGEPWQIGIQNPDGGDVAGVISVEGTMAVVTSGDYQRCFEQDGKRYHHIFNPATGYPAQTGIRSVTVICADGLTADVLSTALFVMGPEQAAAFWQESDDFEAVFILTDGSILATEGAVLSGCDYQVIHCEN